MFPHNRLNKLCGRPPQDAPAPCKLDLLTLKVVSESHVTWATYVPILVFLSLSVLNLRPMYATDVRQTDVRQKHRLMPPPYGGGGIIIMTINMCQSTGPTCTFVRHRHVEVQVETVFILVVEIRHQSTIVLQTASRHCPRQLIHVWNSRRKFPRDPRLPLDSSNSCELLWTETRCPAPRGSVRSMSGILCGHTGPKSDATFTDRHLRPAAVVGRSKRLAVA